MRHSGSGVSERYLVAHIPTADASDFTVIVVVGGIRHWLAGPPFSQKTS